MGSKVPKGGTKIQGARKKRDSRLGGIMSQIRGGRGKPTKARKPSKKTGSKR